MEVMARGFPQLLGSHFSSVKTTTPVKLSLLELARQKQQNLNFKG